MKNIDSKLRSGVFAANLTPQKKDLSIDYEKLISHCKWLLANGCNGIAPLGTTGEANSFTVKERISLLESLIEGGIAPNCILVGTGCCAIEDTVLLTKHAISHKVGGVLVLPPFYYKGISDEGLFRVFAKIIEQVNDENLRIYIYHFPKMTGIPFSFSLIKRLIENFSQIVGMKDSGGDWSNMELICKSFPDFRVYAGSERFLLDILKVGGVGCITATTNVTCRLAYKIFNNWKRYDVSKMQEELTNIRLLIEKYPLIPALKQIMAISSSNDNWLNMRPPIIPLNNKDAETLEEKLQSIGFIKKILNKML